jgi:hypothetical protein
MRRRHPQEWELRDPRFEELDSEDDGYGQGVVLDPNTYAARDARARGVFVSDELYFDGYDIGQDRISRRGMYDQAQFDDDLDSDELEYREQRGLAFQQAVRDKEEALLQSAMVRIARARAKGRSHANLTPEEADALEAHERRRIQQPEHSLPLASPPATPAKNAKGIKASSRSASSTSLSSKSRKRGGSGLFGGNSTSPAKSNSKAKVSRKPSAERALPYPPGQTPQTVVVQGPDGTPVYAPIGYYGPPSPEFIRSQTRSSQPSSRSASKHSRRESTPPERTAEYVQYPLRYYNPGTARPDSSGSNRSLPDEVEWNPPPLNGRYRSSSNVPYPPTGYATDYEGALLPAAQGRRNVSGPPEVRYSSLRRVPPSSPLAQRPVPAHASHSDPTVVKRASGLSQQVGGSSESSESSSSSDDAGVQVEILPDPTSANGYSITRAPVAAVATAAQPPSGNEGRRRKARK